MTKAKRKEPDQEKNEVMLEYNLHDLPTAQHKAGLAGMAFLVQSMNDRKLSDAPEVQIISPSVVRIIFTKATLKALMNDLYSASWVEVESKSKWQGKTPKREAEKEIVSNDGKKKTEKRFVYDAFRPDGKFLECYLPDGDVAWLKLWREMLWNTLRGIPTTRNVYEERADGKDSSEASKIWEQISKPGQRGLPKTDGIGSTILIGAQDKNAERVAFCGEVSLNLLLLFWHLAVVIFVPRRYTSQGEWEDGGYCLVVPEPVDLQGYLEDYKSYLQSLNTEIFGYRPKDSLITIPEEGGLEYLYHLSRRRLVRQELSFSLTALEIYLLQKQGNNIRTLAAEKILPSTHLLDLYESLRNESSNPLYKTQRIRNLLSGSPWFSGMDALFNQYPYQFFVHVHGDGADPQKRATPLNAPFFGNDARKKFQAIRKGLEMSQGGEVMDENRLAGRIYDLIQNYVNRKTEAKSGKNYDQFKDNKDEKGRVVYPRDYLEAREKVCSDAFLAMRGRRDKDFVEYFSGSICSVPQYLPQEDFLSVSQALITDWEKVKTLSMLALSANSWAPKA